MCDFRGCENEGTAAPRFVLVFSDGQQKWEIHAISGLKICESCRPRVTLEGTIAKNLIDGVAAMRPGVKLISSTLEWIPFTHPEWIAMKKISPN